MGSGPLKAVGVWFRSQRTNRYLYLLRNDTKHPGAWGLPGGKLEPGETLLDGMKRECMEELGLFPMFHRLIPLETFTSADNLFEYHTWICLIADEFMPTLNDEHLGYAWLDSGHFPKPMHPGLWNTVNIEAVQNKILLVEQDLVG